MYVTVILCSYVGRVINNKYGAGSGQIWLDDVECVGNETSIGDCPHACWGYHDCRHHEDVSITCNNESLTTTTAPPTSSLGTATRHAVFYPIVTIHYVRMEGRCGRTV